MNACSAAELSRQCPDLDSQLLKSLLNEAQSMERRHLLGDWEPATLDGGQFAEIAARIIYHVDSGTLNTRKSVHKCLSYIEDPNNSNTHRCSQRRSLLHHCRVLRMIYKFRSQRGAIHIDPSYTANELDCSLLMANVRWMVADLLRLFWTGDQSEIAQIVRELMRFPVPAVLSFERSRLVLRTDCTTEEEALILLHSAGEEGMSRTDLGQHIPKSPTSVTKSLKRLVGLRQVIRSGNGHYTLTPLGTKRIRDELATKLSLE